MNYETFLRRRERWDELEAKLSRLDQALTARGKRRRTKRRDKEVAAAVDHQVLEEIVLDYRMALSDYAMARSRFPGTWAARHLAQLVARANHRLRTDTQQRSFGLGALLRFYRTTFPRLFGAMAQEVLLCTGLFLVAILLGVALTTLTPNAGTVFLGADAIKGLEQGKIWTDQIEGNGSFFSAAIARNNMKVAMTAWAGGLAAGLGSLLIVFFNGLMLGVVLATTVHYAMQGALLEFISAHGPLELTLILVAGAAGLHMGRAMISEGDRPRSERLAEAGKTSVLVLLGCLPFFLTLGFVEGYLSPSANLSIELKVAVGLALELAFLAVALRGILQLSSPNEGRGSRLAVPDLSEAGAPK